MFCRRFENPALARRDAARRSASMPNDPIRPLTLAHGLAFTDLYSTAGAARVDGLFVAHLEAADAALAARLAPRVRARTTSARKAESELLIALGPHLEDFLGALFGIEPMCGRSRRDITSWRRFTRSSASSSSARR